MGIYPPVWGHHQWAMLHIMAETYPTKPSDVRKKSMHQYLSSMCLNLPCGGCAMHAVEYLRAHPPKLDSRDDLVLYIIDFHNDVNKRTGKKVYSHDEARELIRTQFFQAKDWVRLHRAEQVLLEAEKARVKDGEWPQWVLVSLIATVVALLLVVVLLGLKLRGKL